MAKKVTKKAPPEKEKPAVRTSDNLRFRNGFVFVRFMNQANIEKEKGVRE